MDATSILPNIPRGRSRSGAGWRSKLVTDEIQVIFGHTLTSVSLFKYIVQILMASENYWTEMTGNLRKAQKKCDWLSRILVREGEKPRVSGMFFKVVVQAVLLFGSDMWVMTPHMVRALGFSAQGGQL